jgi:hypothetical protein
MEGVMPKSKSIEPKREPQVELDRRAREARRVVLSRGPWIARRSESSTA